MTTRHSFPSILLLVLALLAGCSAPVIPTGTPPQNTTSVPTVAISIAKAPADTSPTSTVIPEVAAATPTPTFDAGSGDIDATAERDEVFAVRQGEPERLQVPSKQKVFLGLGDGVDVNRQGYAILRYKDLWAAEVLRDASLEIHKLVGDRQNLAAEVRLRSGALFNNLYPAEAANLELRIQGDLAMVVALNASVAVVEEATTPLQWTVALSISGPVRTTGTVQVITSDAATFLGAGTATWAAPEGPPGPQIAFDPKLVEQWLQNLQNGIEQPEIGEILLPPADLEANVCAQAPQLEPNQPFDMEGIAVTLASGSAFGPASYWVDDCNDDGLQDIAMRNGSLRMDFRGLPARVRALDVSMVNRVDGDTGFLAVLDPAVQEIDRQTPAAQVGQEQLLSLRSEPGYPYHYAELMLKEGCFLGASLTPPSIDGTPGAPRSPAPETFPIPGAQCQLATGRGKAPRTQLLTGPGTDYPSTSALVQRGDAVVPLAQSPAGDWLLLEAPNGQQGWAPMTFLDCVEIRCLPIVESPPPPRPTATVEPTPVPTLEPTPPEDTPTPEPTPTPTYTPM